jgi:hypothetical protein
VSLFSIPNHTVENGGQFAKTNVMSPEERERVNKVCAQIQVEQDRQRFNELITELNTILERKGQRLEEREKQQSQ